MVYKNDTKCNLVGECWGVIQNYEKFYQISDLGRVKRTARTIACENNVIRNVREIILKEGTNSCGYPTVNLSKKGTVKTVLVHRLVAIAFIPNPENKPQVNHKRGNKKDNRALRLEWCTAKENQQHASATGLSPKGDRHSVAKLTWEQVREIRKSNLYHRELGEIYKVSRRTIGNIKNNDTWKE